MREISGQCLLFFHQEGVLHHKYFSKGCTANKEYYLEIPKRLRDAVRRKRPHLKKSRERLLYHNASAHLSHLIQNFSVEQCITQLRQVWYCPNTAPCDFWLFSKLKINKTECDKAAVLHPEK